MKWLAFGFCILVGIPLMAFLASSSRQGRVLLIAALVASTVVKISVNIASLEDYRGPDRGFEISLSDLITIGLCVGLVFSQWKKVRWAPMNLFPFLILVGLAILSLSNSPDTQLSGFTIFKWLKTAILYWTVFNCVWCDWPVEGLIAGIVSAGALETAIGFHQKYVIGMYRINGTFDHSNAIPAYFLMIIPILMCWIFARNRHWSIVSLGMASILGMCFVVAATMSRAGLLLMGIAVISTLLYSIAKSPTLPKLGFATFMGLIMAGGGIKAMDSFVERFENAPKSSAEARDEFNIAADLMASDNMLGVGINCFSHVMTNNQRYRDSVHVMQGEEHAGVCHHIYRLTAAEIGNLGMYVMISIFGRFVISFVPHALGANGEEGCLLFGILIGSLSLHAVGLFEWVFRTTPVWNLFWITSACGAATVVRLRNQRRAGFVSFQES